MNLKRQMLSYTTVNVLNAGVPFILLPILTTYLSPSDYGLLSLIQLLMVVSLPIVLMNVHGLITIEYSKLPFEKFKNLVSTIIWIPILGFLFLEFIFFLFEQYIIQYFHIPTEYIYYIPIFILFQVVPTIIPIIFQAKKEILNFGKYKIAMTVINILLSLFLIILYQYGWEGRLYGIVGSFFLFSIIGLIILYKLDLLKFIIDKQFLQDALSYGLPLIPHSISVSLLAMSDRIFLSSMTTVEAVGLYAVAFQISSITMIIFTSINQAWVPNFYEILNSKPTLNIKKSLVLNTYKIMLVMFILTIVFILVSPIIFHLFINERYSESENLIYIIAFAFMFKGFYFMVTNYIFYVKKTYLLSYITVSSVIVISLLNYILIGKFAIYGAAYAMLISNIVFFIIVWYFANKIYPMPWFK